MRKEGSFVDPEKARSEEAKIFYTEIESSGLCPFCFDNYGDFNSEEQIDFENNSWFVFPNIVPYKNSAQCLVVVHKEHIESWDMLSNESWIDMGEVMRWAANEKGIETGGIASRFGDINQNAASVAHLHFHIFEPYPDSRQTGNVIRFTI